MYPGAEASTLSAKLAELLACSTPRLPDKVLQPFIEKYLHRRTAYLKVLDTHPSPVYLLEPDTLRRRANRLVQAFGGCFPSLSVYYAVKSNNHPQVARTLLEAGLGLDVSSGLELEMALELGARDIVFSGPGKTVPELHLAATHAERVTILLDSPGEMDRLETVAAGLGRTIRCGVRLTVNPSGLWRKFGINLEGLPDFWRMARQLRHIHLAGLQFHVSWNLNPAPQADFIGKLGAVLAGMPAAYLAQLTFIDMGGGYWPSQGEWLQPGATPRGQLNALLGGGEQATNHHYFLPAAPIEDFADLLSAAVQKHIFPVVRCRICLEPGRWICNDAMHLLVSVVDKKADDLVITDAGTNCIGWERFESDYIPILNLTRPSRQERPCHILGSLCTPHDIWGTTYFGSCIETGDVLMIPTQGAYTYSLRQHFIKPLPKVVSLPAMPIDIDE